MWVSGSETTGVAVDCIDINVNSSVSRDEAAHVREVVCFLLFFFL